MESPPRTDSDVPPYWQALGLPGLVDAHVHVMPPRLLDKVWAYFDAAGPLIGRPWPIEYRWPQERRLQHLRGLGVRAFPTLLYAHKPQMASSLNDWARDFAREQREAGHTGRRCRPARSCPSRESRPTSPGRSTRAPGCSRCTCRSAASTPATGCWTRSGGCSRTRVSRLWSTPAAGPRPGAFTGPGPFGEVLARHPRLTAVIAHMGMPQHAEFLDLAERYANVHLDTTMVFVDFFDGATVQTQLARSLAPRLSALRDRVLLGTDFPNIPYAYAHQLEALTRTGLDDDWMRAVLWHNGARLFGVSADVG